VVGDKCCDDRLLVSMLLSMLRGSAGGWCVLRLLFALDRPPPSSLSRQRISYDLGLHFRAFRDYRCPVLVS